MGRNAQRRRQRKNMEAFLRSIRPSVSQQLSSLAQQYQADNPDIIFNRATRRQQKAPTWYRRGR